VGPDTFFSATSPTHFEAGLPRHNFTTGKYDKPLFGAYIQDDWRIRSQPDIEPWPCATRWPQC